MDRCECRGECGLDHSKRRRNSPIDPARCSVPDGIRIVRYATDPVFWYEPLALWFVEPDLETFRPAGRQELKAVKTPGGRRLFCSLCIAHGAHGSIPACSKPDSTSPPGRRPLASN